MNKTIHLRVSNSIKNGKSQRITHLSKDDGSKPIEIFYEFDRIVPFNDNTNLDGHVLAVLLYLAGQRLPVRVHGSLSATCLRNMNEIQLAWKRWRPQLYGCVEIVPDNVAQDHSHTTKNLAIAAFSGGVDATFTALSHTKLLPELVRYPLRSVLMVKGFDVDLDNSHDFKQLVNRVKPLLNELNLDLRTMSTNSRELRIQNWYYSSGIELGGCLQMLSDEFRYGLIGSGNSYESLAIPSGSSPISDHLMTTDRMSIIHDGAGFCRTEKVNAITKFPTALRSLKVCWAGADQSNNCGRCEKCIRTRLNFIAANYANPECFEGDLDLELIKDLYVENEGQLNELKGILTYANEHNISGLWADALMQRINTWIPVDDETLNRKRYGSPTKKAIVKAIEKAGLRAPVQKIWRSSRRSVYKLKNASL